jgi:hypothetical protein
MTVPYTFGTATTSIPLSNLDSNFNTPITLGNTSIYLGNTTTTIGNLTLTNATISSGNVTISNISVTTANVTTANVATLSVTGTATIATANITTGNITTLTSTSITNAGLTSGRVTYAGASGLLSDSANLVFNGTNLGIGTGVTPNKPLTIYKVSDDAEIRLQAGSNDLYLSARNSGGQFDIFNASNAGIRFGTNNAEKLFITGSSNYIYTASGVNVGIGTSSPNAALSIVASVMNSQIVLGINSSNANYGSISLNGSSADNGRLGITGGGTGDNTLYIDVPSTGQYAFRKGTTQAMTLDASGNLLVGATSLLSSERLLVEKSNANAYVAAFNNSNNASGDQSIYSRLGTNANNTSSYHFIANIGNTTDKLYIFGNGNVVNSNNSYGTLSDIKLKENIVDTTAKLADVMQLKVRNFNLKTEPNNKQIGFIAQELETIFPALIDNTASPNDKNNVIKSIKTSVLIPILVKAIQEQQALIESLTTRLTNLENK